MAVGPGNGRERVAKEAFQLDRAYFQHVFLVYAAGEGSRSHQFSLLADPELLTCRQDRHLPGTALVGMKVSGDAALLGSDRFAFEN